jgi:glycogen debranching enzyme
MDSSLQRWGKVFYVNVLYWKALAVGRAFAGAPGGADQERVRRALNGLFWPEAPVDETWLSGWGSRFYEEQVDREREHYLNFLTFEAYDSRCDVLANCLAVLWSLADAARSQRILDFIARRRLADPYPVRVLDPPAFTGDRSWNPKVDLDRPAHWRNPPFAFHNAGVWPWVGGFYVAALARAGRRLEAEAALERLAAACRAGREAEWEFNEWLEGRTGEPLGAVRQTWSAAGYVIAYRAVSGG